MNTQTITVEAVNVKDKKNFTYKSGNKKGQQGFLYPIGLNVGGKWINGTAFSEDEADIFRKLEKGNKITLVLYEEEYNGKMYDKFKLPNDKDQLKAGLEELKARIEAIEQTIASLVSNNKLIYKKPNNNAGRFNEVDKKLAVTVYGNSTINPNEEDLPF